MKLKTIALIAGTVALAGACSPAPGSAEWCKGIETGTVKPTFEEAMAHGEKCAELMINSTFGPAQ
jgi:hypothetical protein